MFDYWAEFPPVHILLRGFVGYEPPVKRSQEEAIMEAMPVLSSQNGKIPGALKAPDWVKDILRQADELNAR